MLLLMKQENMDGSVTVKDLKLELLGRFSTDCVWPLVYFYTLALRR
jgi:hypothetical protein